MQDQTLTPAQIRTFFFVMKKHRWKTSTIFFLTTVSVAVGSLLMTPIYRASSKLLVKPGREDVYVPPTGDSPPVIDSSIDQKVNSEIAILTSSGLVMALVDRFGVDRLFDFPDRTLKGRLFKETERKQPPPREKVYKALERSLEVTGVRRSNVINVSFEWPDPEIAAKLVNSLVDLYLAQHVKVHTDRQTYTLLEDQASKWKEKLRESERQLEAFKHRHIITSLPEQRTILLERLSEVESDNKETESGIQETLEMIGALRDQVSNLDQDVHLQERVNRDSETLTALKARLVDLELQGIKEEINRVKEMIAEEEKKEQVVVVSGQSPIRQNLEGDLLRAEVRLKALQAKVGNQKLQLVNYREELKNLDGHEKQLNILERQVAINEANYRLYLTKFEEARILETMDKQKIANVRIIDPAVPPSKPIKPKKRLIVLIGGFLGLFGGIGMAFLKEFVHPVFRSREDVDQFLGLPVLATLPREKVS